MKNAKTSKISGIKKETALLYIFIALIVGFIGGVIFSAYKLESDANVPNAMPPQRDHAADAHITELQKQVAKDPNNVAAWIELGNLFFDAQQNEKAIQAYETALKIKPDNADVWTDLGVMYRKKGDAQKALEAFQKAYSLNPKHEISLFNAGVVLMHDLNKPKEAREMWEKLLKLNPSAKTPSGQSIRELLEKMQ